MDKKTVKILNKINLDFYKTTAIDFNESRQYFWKGWDNLIKYLKKYEEIMCLDLGCGNARFFSFIKKEFPKTKLEYLGIDSNQELLNIAKNRFDENIFKNTKFELQNKDLINSMMENSLSNYKSSHNKSFNVVTSFGVFHHIPSYKLRLQFLNFMKSLISDDGLIIISLWQFMNHERFHKKIANLQQLKKLSLENSLEVNDYILDWKKGKKALRYCHFLNNEEEKKLISESELSLIESFQSDGKEGNVNTYLVLKKK